MAFTRHKIYHLLYTIPWYKQTLFIHLFCVLADMSVLEQKCLQRVGVSGCMIITRNPSLNVLEPQGLIRPASLAAAQASLPAHVAPLKGLDTTGVRRIIVSKVHTNTPNPRVHTCHESSTHKCVSRYVVERVHSWDRGRSSRTRHTPFGRNRARVLFSRACSGLKPYTIVVNKYRLGHTHTHTPSGETDISDRSTLPRCRGTTWTVRGPRRRSVSDCSCMVKARCIVASASSLLLAAWKA
jgi:hypothetical protein